MARTIWDGPNSKCCEFPLGTAIIVSLIKSLIPFYFLPQSFLFSPATDHDALHCVCFPPYRFIPDTPLLIHAGLSFTHQRCAVQEIMNPYISFIAPGSAEVPLDLNRGGYSLS